MPMKAALSLLRTLRMMLVRDGEFVADPVPRQDVARSLRVWFHLAPQILDVRVHGPLVPLERMALDPVDELHAGEDLIGMARQNLQQPELRRGQVHAPPLQA